MRKKTISTFVLVALGMCGLISAGCNSTFVSYAARDSFVYFAETIFAGAIEEAVFPNGG